MAMQPEYYPGDSYEEYLRMLAGMGNPTDVFARSLSPFTRPQSIPSFGAIPGFQYNDYLGADPTRGLRISSFKKDFPKAQKLDNPGATFPLNQTMEEDPVTVLRRNTDRARNYPREFGEMFNPSLNPEGDIGRYIPNNPAVSQSAKVQPPAQGPARPASDTRLFNYQIPATPKTPAAQAQSGPAQGGGLLDVDTDFFDDPTRMGLLQAGLGLMSAPRYSTNPNDVTLSSALARGLGGFIQGYGGTKKRLTEAEREKIEDEWKRTQMDKDIEYKDALIQMYGIQGEAQRKTAELNATEKQLQKQAINTQIERILEFEGKLGNATRRLELKRLGTADNTNQQNQFADLYREATNDRTPMEETLVASGKYTEEQAKKLRFTALETQYNKTLDLQTNPPKPESVPQGSAQERYTSDLQRVVGDSSLLNTPFHENAWALYYQSELEPKVSQDSVITKPSIYPVPDKYKYLFDSAQVDGKSVDNMGGFFVTSKPSDAQSKQLNSALADLAAVQKVEDQVIKIGIPNLEARLKQDDPEVAKLASQYGNMLMQLKESYNLGVLQELDKQEMQNIINNPTDPKSIRNIMRTVPLFTAQANVVKEAILDRNRPLANQYNINLENRFAQTYPGTQLTFSVPANLPTEQSKLNKRTDEILQGTGPIDVAPLQLNNGNDSDVPWYERTYNNLMN